MKKSTHRFRRAGLALASALIVATAPTAALAAPPVSTTIPLADSFVDTDLCGFPVQVNLEGSATLHEFFDRQGSLTRVIAQVTIEFTGSTNAGTVHQRARAMEHFDFDGDGSPTYTNTGLFAQVRDEDGRLIAVESGQRVESPPGTPLSFVGNERSVAEVAAQCAALSE